MPDLYMSKLPYIDASIRAQVVEWMVELAQEYYLAAETLYLAVNYFDRYMSSVAKGRKRKRNKQQLPRDHENPRDRIQLVAIACMVIAGKFEEVHAPSLGEYKYQCNNAYTEKEVRSTTYANNSFFRTCRLSLWK